MIQTKGYLELSYKQIQCNLNEIYDASYWTIGKDRLIHKQNLILYLFEKIICFFARRNLNKEIKDSCNSLKNRLLEVKIQENDKAKIQKIFAFVDLKWEPPQKQQPITRNENKNALPLKREKKKQQVVIKTLKEKKSASVVGIDLLKKCIEKFMKEDDQNPEYRNIVSLEAHLKQYRELRAEDAPAQLKKILEGYSDKGYKSAISSVEGALNDYCLLDLIVRRVFPKIVEEEAEQQFEKMMKSFKL